MPVDAPVPSDPVSNVRWVHMDKVVANNYNPNKCAPAEMRLLYLSIKADGFTQPIVTVYDADQDKYIVVDGFHRSLVCRTYPDIAERTGGRVPIVVIDKPINDRMASTVRHNRARGKHSVDGMASMVFTMLENGWQDDAICNELGLEAEELVRLKHITGFSKLFEDIEYRKSWESVAQVKLRTQYERASHPDP
jgi:ParB-like chromosome segregation protein Spo0J